MQITMAITRFEERKAEWDSGEVFDVNGVGENFTKGQYWTREVGCRATTMCLPACG